MKDYSAPSITSLGSLHELTLSTIHKTSGSGDFIVINGVPETAPGGTVTSVS